MKTWRAYERLIALLTTDEHNSESSTVIPNARMKGYISGRKRQIDVLVDFRYSSDLSRRIIIDAKNRKRPVDIKDVESFEGLMRDVGAKHGILVCANGHTKSALKRAQQHIGIKLIPESKIEELNIYSWDACLHETCSDGLVLWDTTPGLFIEGTAYIQATGKCDACGKFHVWCWSCGNRAFLHDEDEWQCSCKGPWFWLTAIEEESNSKGRTNQAVYLLLPTANDVYMIDRRPL